VAEKATIALGGIKDHGSQTEWYTSVYLWAKVSKKRFVCYVLQEYDTLTFYPRDAMLAQSLRQQRVCPSVCPSVRLSHSGIVPSRAKAGSWNVHHL